MRYQKNLWKSWCWIHWYNTGYMYIHVRIYLLYLYICLYLLIGIWGLELLLGRSRVWKKTTCGGQMFFFVEERIGKNIWKTQWKKTQWNEFSHFLVIDFSYNLGSFCGAQTGSKSMEIAMTEWPGQTNFHVVKSWFHDQNLIFRLPGDQG